MKNVAVTKMIIKIEHCESRRIRCIARQDIPEIGILAGEKFHLVRVSGSSYMVKKITVLSRVVNMDGSVTSEVLSSSGEVYTTTLRRNHEHSCSCPATKECIHIDCLRHLENARAQKRRAAALAQHSLKEAA